MSNPYNLKAGDELFIARGGGKPSAQYEKVDKVTKKYLYIQQFSRYYYLKVDLENLQVVDGHNLRGYRPTVFLDEQEYLDFIKEK